MEYLLVMSLSGSTMTAISLLLRFLFKDRISARMYYLLARTAALYYLIPLPFLKRWYGEAIRVFVPDRRIEIAQISLAWTNYTVHADGRMYVNTYAGIQIAIVLVWLLVAGFLMARQLSAYLKTARRIARYTELKMTERQETILAGLKEEYGIKRHIVLYQEKAGVFTITFGVWRPVIVCGREVGSREAEILIRHEMTHIRRLDALWKMLLQLVKFLHWWNLLMWMLYREFDRVCEMSCDETVMRGKTEEEIKEYLRLLIEEAREEEKPENPLVRWKSGFGIDKRKIRERMDNLMRKKRWNRFVTGALAAALIFVNSMTVFAYRDTFHEVISEDVSQDEIESTLNVDETLFVPEGVNEETEQEFEMLLESEILYDRQFTDEKGNVYPVDGETLIDPQWGCDHNYVSGTLTDHTKNSDGSCDVVKYHAQRCSKCGTVIRGDYIASSHFAVCPH